MADPTVQISYVIDTGNIPASDLEVQADAVPLYQVQTVAGIIEPYQMTLKTDATSASGDFQLTRVITFNLPAAAQELFPTADAAKDAVRNLYTDALIAALGCMVTASEPVYTP